MSYQLQGQVLLQEKLDNEEWGYDGNKHWPATCPLGMNMVIFGGKQILDYKLMLSAELKWKDYKDYVRKVH